ncbi:hypothetical protein GA0070624_3202 [Micromonospora rhizosphaerae]|uniref:TadE-like protein n=1 Tax=Micromonospora rhizosphaerae TaxID=568872 RepID=A0A1C6S8U4_9ACTN|nr:hypothetical protein [Micromonospora rhizosphaerae]SCL25917.1 hypothetical protein GA0070624_3202 [Micromonospora rhizosphaerae]
MSNRPTTVRRRRSLASAVRGDRGAWSVEVAGFFLPCMLLAIVVVAAAFQLAISRLDLESASAAAARAASLQRSSTAATAAARQAAENDLAGRSITCARLVVAVDTSRWQRGGSVTVTVTCTVNLSTLAMMNAIPGQMTASSTSTAPIDTYRSVALGAVGDRPAAGAPA